MCTRSESLGWSSEVRARSGFILLQIQSTNCQLFGIDRLEPVTSHFLLLLGLKPQRSRFSRLSIRFLQARKRPRRDHEDAPDQIVKLPARRPRRCDRREPVEVLEVPPTVPPVDVTDEYLVYNDEEREARAQDAERAGNGSGQRLVAEHRLNGGYGHDVGFIRHLYQDMSWKKADRGGPRLPLAVGPPLGTSRYDGTRDADE